ncbi:MAG: radical SAM protein [Candidatus Omnitrophota bacterium]
MNILFIYSLYNVRGTKKPLHTQEQVSFGVSYISACLKERGHDTKLLVLNRVDRGHESSVDGAIRAFKPRMVCVSAVTLEFPFISRIAGYIKSKYPDIYLLAGGMHVSLAPEEAIAGPFDAICIGEGEAPAAEIAGQIEKGQRPSGIMNLWIKNGDSIERNPARPFAQDLDALPFPDRRIWREWISEGAGTKYSILAGRGCPFECAYCCNHAVKKLAPGNYVRFRSPDNIIAELEECCSDLPAHDTVYFEMESMASGGKWAHEFLSKLKGHNLPAKRALSYGTNIRITKGADLDGLFSEMSGAGFKYVNIGLESGSERIRKELLRRDYSDGDMAAAVEAARRHGLKVCLNSIMGLPDETEEDINKTVELNRICRPDWHFVSIFYPYPGTDLYAYCAGKGLIKKPLAEELESKKANILLPKLPARALEKNYLWFNYNVYRGYKPTHVLLARVFRLWLWTKLHGSRAYRRLVDLAPFRWFKVLE